MSKKERQGNDLGHENVIVRMIDDERVILAQREIIAAQHRVLNACADALHEMRRAIGAYADVKTGCDKRVLRLGEAE